MQRLKSNFPLFRALVPGGLPFGGVVAALGAPARFKGKHLRRCCREMTSYCLIGCNLVVSSIKFDTKPSQYIHQAGARTTESYAIAYHSSDLPHQAATARGIPGRNVAKNPASATHTRTVPYSMCRTRPTHSGGDLMGDGARHTFQRSVRRGRFAFRAVLLEDNVAIPGTIIGHPESYFFFLQRFSNGHDMRLRKNCNKKTLLQHSHVFGSGT